MSTQNTVAPQFHISIKTAYVEAESQPEKNHYFFIYRVTIKNMGNAPAQLMSRHWMITDAFGHKEEVRGPGVIGVQPKINSGQTFEYESACPLPTSSGSMKGFYHMISDEGESFSIEIPEFYLLAPTALH